MANSSNFPPIRRGSSLPEFVELVRGFANMLKAQAGMVRDRFDGPTKNAILGPFKRLGPDKNLFLILIFFARVLLHN